MIEKEEEYEWNLYHTVIKLLGKQKKLITPLSINSDEEEAKEAQ